MTATQMMFRVKGTTDDVTTCELCGREDLKGTIVLAYLDADGNEGDVTYMGSDCGARAAGWTQGEIRKAARRADKATKDAADLAAKIATRDARYRKIGAIYIVTYAAVVRRGLSEVGVHNGAATFKRQAYSRPITVTDLDGNDVTAQFPEFAN